MKLQGHHFEIIHRDGQQHFDADAVSRILHSGDINDARESGSGSEEEHLVTMKDIRNLERFFKLQLSQHQDTLIGTKREISVITPTSTSSPIESNKEEVAAAEALIKLSATNTTEL
jgi:hypothetical protein